MENRLQEFRNLIAHYEITECNEIIPDIFKLLTADQAITIALEILKPHFSTFEAFHPEITWPRDWVGYIERREAVDYSSSPFGLYDEEGIFGNRSIDRPGSSAFLEAIQLLDNAFRSYLSNERKACCALAGNSAICAIGSRTVAFWAELNPQAHEIYMGNPNILDPHSPEEDEKIREAARKFRNSSRVRKFRKGMYLEIHDYLYNQLVKKEEGNT